MKDLDEIVSKSWSAEVSFSLLTTNCYMLTSYIACEGAG